MNTNLQSQQSRHRQQQSVQKFMSKESSKSEDLNASDNNMLIRRKEIHNIPLSIYVTGHSPNNTYNSYFSKNPIIMANTKKGEDVRGASSATERDEASKIDIPHPNDV